MAIEGNQRAQEEVEPPDRGDGLIDAEEERRTPDLRRRLLARVLDRERRADDERSPGDRHQRQIDDERHVGREDRPAEADQADRDENEEGQGDGVEDLEGMAERLPRDRDRGNRERQDQSKERPAAPQRPEDDPGQESDDEPQHGRRPLLSAPASLEQGASRWNRSRLIRHSCLRGIQSWSGGNLTLGPLRR